MTNKNHTIGNHVEPFVDDALIGVKDNVCLTLHPPVKREVITFDQPWDKRCPIYCTFMRDADGAIRLYYRETAASGDFSDQQTAGLAFSDDGIHFKRPNLGLIERNGSKDNNLIWMGTEAHNLTPFIDSNPKAEADERYKATGGPMWKLFGLCSPDGIHWRKMREEPLEHEGVFDSQNVTFWDTDRGCYRCFSRYFEGGWPKGIRGIQSATSEDYIHWSQPQPHAYTGDMPLEHFYTNATIRYPGHPNLLLSFPKRFIYERKAVDAHPHKGVSDAVFMSSRNGVQWDRPFAEAWVRPGLDLLNWTERSNMIALGMLELAPDEWSLYINEHNRCQDARVRRMTVRKHGFASVHAGFHGGSFTTRPLTFGPGRLHLNFSTSAAGSIQVELQEPGGRPIPGYSLDAMEPVYGDSVDRAVTWKDSADLSSLAGQSVCLRFVMREADLFSMRVGE